MSKFKISLALKKQCNYEIEVEAADEKEAIAIAIEDFEERAGGGEIIEFDDAEIEADFEFDEKSEERKGIDCEEIVSEEENERLRKQDKEELNLLRQDYFNNLI